MSGPSLPAGPIRPHPALRPLIGMMWASQPAAATAARELVLPTGAMHLVIRLAEEPLRLFASAEDAVGSRIGTALVGGARAAPYLRDVSSPVASVGAMLLPGAATALLGVPATELAGRHVRLEDLWGTGAHELRERLAAAGSSEERLELFESLLLRRLTARRMHPAVAHALGRFERTTDIRVIVDETGTSHRHFIELFRNAVGLAPKVYCRVLRFQRALRLHADDPAMPWAELALAAGYADQPHLGREFRELAGISPGRYRELAPSSPNHVPLG